MNIKSMIFREEADDKAGAQEKAHVPDSKDFRDFAKKFSAPLKAPIAEGGKPDNETNQKNAEQMKADSERIESEREVQKEEGAKKAEEMKEKEVKKPGPFIRQQIEQKKKAESDKEQALTQVEEYKEKLSATEKRIEALQAKIDSGDFSAKKEEEFQLKIADLEQKAQTERESLVNENKNLKSKLSFHDLSQDERFRKEYLQPVYVSYQDAVQALGQDKDKKVALDRALVANSAALRADNEADRLRAEDDRDNILSAIVDDLPGFKGGRFTEAINAYIKSAHKHALALFDHEKTSAAIKAKAREEHDLAYSDRIESWGKSFNAAAERYKNDEVLSDEDVSLAKEQGFDYHLEKKKADVLAKKTVSGEAGMLESVDVVQRGRVYPALKAKIAALEKKLSDSQETIKKIRNGSTASSGKPEAIPVKQEKKSMEQWMSKYTPAGRG